MSVSFLKRSNPFKPAVDILADRFGLSPASRKASHQRVRSNSQDDPGDMSFSNLDTPKSSTGGRVHPRTSSAELDPRSGIPLIDYSRTPSPTPHRTRSGTQSEEENEDIPVSLRPLVAQPTTTSFWKVPLKDGGLGAFLFGSWAGWQVYVGLITIWHVGASLFLVFFNRIILMTGVYKFPYPLTATWIQLFFCHLYLLGWATLSRGLAGPLRKLGLSAVIAPSNGKNARPGNARGLISTALASTGGVAGGGVFEFDRNTALQVLPLSIIFVVKLILSNISFAYSPLPLYTICRIGVLPFTLIFTSAFARTTHSIPTLSAALTAWLNLLIASIRTRSLVSWEAIVAGVFSMLFVALYPVLLERTHKLLLASQIRPGDVFTTFSPTRTGPATTYESGNKQSTRAYYQLLHYNSVISLVLLFPLVFISGESVRISRNCYFLDVFWFWFMCACGGYCAFAVYISTPAFIRTTSALTVVFTGVPRAAVQIMIFSNFRLPVHSWVGVALCWFGSGWYALVRREEGRLGEKRRLEGR